MVQWIVQWTMVQWTISWYDGWYNGQYYGTMDGTMDKYNIQMYSAHGMMVSKLMTKIIMGTLYLN